MSDVEVFFSRCVFCEPFYDGSIVERTVFVFFGHHVNGCVESCFFVDFDEFRICTVEVSIFFKNRDAWLDP